MSDEPKLTDGKPTRRERGGAQAEGDCGRDGLFCVLNMCLIELRRGWLGVTLSECHWRGRRTVCHSTVAKVFSARQMSMCGLGIV